jgi:hypothetical protein
MQLPKSSHQCVPQMDRDTATHSEDEGAPVPAAYVSPNHRSRTSWVGSPWADVSKVNALMTGTVYTDRLAKRGYGLTLVAPRRSSSGATSRVARRQLPNQPFDCDHHRPEDIELACGPSAGSPKNGEGSTAWLRLLFVRPFLEQLLNIRMVCQPDGLVGRSAEKFGM